jgi:hypothetical protein
MYEIENLFHGCDAGGLDKISPEVCEPEDEEKL